MTGLHPLVNHLAKIHSLVCQLSPTPVEYNLEYGPHQPSSALKELNVTHYNYQETFKKTDLYRIYFLKPLVCNICYKKNKYMYMGMSFYAPGYII